MSQSIVHSVFQNTNDAAGAIEALTSSGFSPRRFCVIGTDSDSFRMATATLQSTKPDKLVLILGITGAILGTAVGAWGVQYMPGFDGTYVSIVTLTAAFSGFAVGLISGLTMGAILRLDGVPQFEAEVRLGNVHDGDIVVSLVTNDSTDRDNALTLLREHGAKHLSIDTTESIVPASKPAQVLSKIA